jgi:hypothetical protein
MQHSFFILLGLGKAYLTDFVYNTYMIKELFQLPKQCGFY